MSTKKGAYRTKILAKLVTEEKGPCAFCRRDVDDELIYGKLYAIGDIKCHYFCALLSCCLVQRGRDEEGLFGFLYPDILAEIERSKKHRCSYCSRDGATIGCCISQCRKQFHLPCGRERNAVSLFYGSYKSYCQLHSPKQQIETNVMAKARVRMLTDKRRLQAAKGKGKREIEKLTSETGTEPEAVEIVCVICYEPVQGYPTLQTFWPPCCARDAWFHRTCLQRMALSAGMHYLKCPLCNDKENFYDAVVSQGYYVPDRDAAWELEQNAFSEIYERPVRCDEEECKCPMGRNHDAETGLWDIKLCLLCGSSGGHAYCLSEDISKIRHVCRSCAPAAPTDLEQLAASIEAVVLAEQAQSSRNVTRRPLMPSRMSLRRTKQRIAYNTASSSRSQEHEVETDKQTVGTTPNLDTATSREELNLKPPKHPNQDIKNKSQKKMENALSPIKMENMLLSPKKMENMLLSPMKMENILLSPMKMLEESLYMKLSKIGADAVVLDMKVYEEVKEKFKKPKPLSEKRKILSNILDNILSNVFRETPKNKEAVKEWCSPKKILDLKCNNDEQENIEPVSQITNSLCEAPRKTLPILLEDKTLNEENNLKVNDKLYSDKENMVNDSEMHDEIEKDANVDKDIDESSSSTFQLPPEFVADDSNDSLPIFETPKLKTVEIEKDSSLEISEYDQVVNVDVVKMDEASGNNHFIKGLNIKSPVKTKKCTLKICPNNETLQKSNVGIDLESFKNHYLNEVAFKCKFSHNHSEKNEKQTKLKTAIDFAMEASNDRKRKMDDSDRVVKKKRKISKSKYVLKYKNVANKDIPKKTTPKRETSKKVTKRKRKEVKKKVSKGKYVLKYKKNAKIQVSKGEDNLKLSLEGKRTKRKKLTRVSIKNKDIKVKIKWKKESLKLKISDSKEKVTSPPSVKPLKQYVLNYSEGTSRDVLEKPEFDVTPIKRKYKKPEKLSDSLVQTSLTSFFKVFPKKENLNDSTESV